MTIVISSAQHYHDHEMAYEMISHRVRNMCKNSYSQAYMTVAV